MNREIVAPDSTTDGRGEYVGFDEGSPLARAGGKRDVLAAWGALPRPVMLVGDGATDLEAQSAVELFVAYAGVAAHERVMREAGFVITSRSLAPVLPLALGSLVPEDLTVRRLYDRGLAMLEPEVRQHYTERDKTHR